MLFVNEQFFVIYDEAIGKAAGTVRTHYQFVPCDSLLSPGALSAETKFSSGPNLLAPFANGSAPPVTAPEIDPASAVF